MASQTTHDTSQRNRNPAEAEMDPQQLTADGTPGENYGLYENTETAQQDGNRSPRMMGAGGAERNSQEPTENTATKYDTPDNAGGRASGVTNQPLDKEKASQGEVGTGHKGARTKRGGGEDGGDDAGLPEGMGAGTDTVEISTMKPKH